MPSKAQKVGKISGNRRLFFALASCLLAAALNVGLTVFGTQISITYCDDHVITRGPKGAAILPLGVSVADTFCAHFGSGPAPDPHRTPAAFATISGLFAREVINLGVAITGGVIAPFLLISFGAYFAFPNKRPMLRVAAIVGLLLGIALGVFFLFFLKNDPVLFLGPARVFNFRELVPLLILLAAPVLFMAGGIFLWRKSSAPKS